MRKKVKAEGESCEKTLKEKLGEGLDIPSDILNGGCTFELRGRGEAYVSGCKKISVFTPNTVKLEMSDFNLIIEGELLTCPGFGAGRIVIGGRIKSVAFEDRG